MSDGAFFTNKLQNSFTPNKYVGVPTVNNIDAGIYEFNPGGQMAPPQALKKVIVSDKVIESEDGVCKEIMAYLSQFLTNEVKDNFVKMGLTYSTAVLAHGRPGTGKTIALNTFSKQFVKDQKGIVLHTSDPSTITMFDSIFRTDKTQPLVVILEEIEMLIEDGYEADLLNLLDGKEKLENVIYLATTNYLDKIPARFKNRPSRFARVIEVKEPVEKMRYEYAMGVWQDEKLAREVARMTEGLVMDEVKHVLINHVCFGAPIQDSADFFRTNKGVLTDDSEEV